MTFVFGNYRIRPFNDVCWTIEHRVQHKKSDRKDAKRDDEWRELPYYAHDLNQALRELMERSIKESPESYEAQSIADAYHEISDIFNYMSETLTQQAEEMEAAE